MSLTLIEPPEDFPISLGDVRLQTKTEGITADDDLISDIYIPAAVERGEIATWRQFLLATWQLVLDEFPCWIDVPKAPLVEGTVEITYVDTAGGTQTVDPDLYVVESPVGPRCRRGRITLAYGQNWPATLSQANAVTVEFGAGYGDEPTDVPALLRHAMLMDVAAMYRLRENVLTGPAAAAIELPLGSRSIYRSYRAAARQ